MSSTNPYDPPSESTPQTRPWRDDNKAAVLGFLLTLVLPCALASLPISLMGSSSAGLHATLRLALICSSPAAIFAVVFGIIGAQGRPTRFSLLALVVGGVECFGVILALLFTIF